MAQSKSTIIAAPGDSTSVRVIEWSSIATGANGLYFDMNGQKGDKAIILILNTDSDHIVAGATGSTSFYIGSSGGSACSCASKENRFYSARTLARKGLGMISSGSVQISVSPTTAAGTICVGIAGPFETARYKDSDGYIHLTKVKRATDNIDYKVAMVTIP